MKTTPLLPRMVLIYQLNIRSSISYNRIAIITDMELLLVWECWLESRDQQGEEVLKT